MDNAYTSGDSVLLIEDDQDLQGIFTEILSQAGYNVRCCGNLRDARNQLNSQRFSFLISDWNLGPGETADSLLFDPNIESLLPPAVLVITSYSERVQFPSRLTGRFHLLEKPFRMDSLPQKLQEMGRNR